MKTYSVARWRVVMVAALLGAVVIGAVLTASGCAETQNKEDQKDIRDASWHYEMAAGYFDSHEIPLAIRELHTSLKMDSKQYKPHYLLAFIYMGRHKYTDAIAHFKKSIQYKPEYLYARNNLGAVYLATERWREAVKVFKGLLKESMYTTPQLAHNNLGWAYFNLRKYRKAIEHFKMAIFLKPKMCLAYNNLGRTYQAMSRPSKAERQYRKALRKCPDNYAEPHFNLAKLLLKRGDPGARRHFEKCRDIQPDSNLADRCRQYLEVR